MFLEEKDKLFVIHGSTFPKIYLWELTKKMAMTTTVDDI